jgi:hypothetical protein
MVRLGFCIKAAEGRYKDRGKMEDRFAGTIASLGRWTMYGPMDDKEQDGRGKTAHFVRWEDHSLCSLGRNDQKEDGRSPPARTMEA